LTSLTLNYYLSTGHVEVLSAHPGVALYTEAGARHLDVLAEGARALPPRLVVKLEESRLGDPVLVEEADLRHVERAHKVDPVSHVGLLVDASYARTHLREIGIFENMYFVFCPTSQSGRWTPAMHGSQNQGSVLAALPVLLYRLPDSWMP
jgi:hypothetical protein